MSTTETTPTTKAKKTSNKGSNVTPPRQYFKAYPGPKIKKATEAFKRFSKKVRLLPEERSALAYFTQPFNSRAGS